MGRLGLEDIKRVEIWRNDTGVTLSNSGNLFLEDGGNARTYWVKAANWTGLNGNRVTGEADSNQPNNTVDTFRGGPALRSEHLHEIDLMAYSEVGFDRMFVEWRGEVVGNSTGFALDAGAPADLARTYWGSRGFCWAAGTFINGRGYESAPPVVCYNDNETGKNSATMAGAASGTATEPRMIAGNFALSCRNPLGWVDDGSQTGKEAFQIGSPGIRDILPHTTGSGNALSYGGLIWGFSKKDSGTDNSRYPTDGDRYGWCYQVGYQQGVITQPGLSQSTNATPLDWGDLRITGLSKIWLAVFELGPPTGASTPYLKFDSGGGASMVVKGSVHVILIRE